MYYVAERKTFGFAGSILSRFVKACPHRHEREDTAEKCAQTLNRAEKKRAAAPTWTVALRKPQGGKPPLRITLAEYRAQTGAAPTVEPTPEINDADPHEVLGI